MHDRRVYSEWQGGIRVKSTNDRGLPFASIYGVPGEIWEYDARGFATSVRFFDVEDKPRLGPDGVHELRFMRDASGFVTETAVFDEARRPTQNHDKYHRITFLRDARGNAVVSRVFGLDGEPVLSSAGR